MDIDGIPISYGLYPGNMLDKQTLIPMIHTIRKDYELGRIIIVADKGMMAGDNIRQILFDKNGYVLSYSIRGANAAFKEYVLEEDGLCFYYSLLDIRIHFATNNKLNI